MVQSVQSVQIVTDSNAGITPAMAKEMGIAGVAATYVIFDGKSYRDSVEIQADEFYQRLQAAPTLPTTSAPSVGDFEDIYKTLKGQEVVSLHISRQLSGTIQAAETAAQMLEGDPKVNFVDTRFVNAGQALLVVEALKLAKAGKSGAEIKTHIEGLIPRLRMHIVLETLENLKRGGRISNTSAFIGNLLQMKPILTIKDGKVEPLERVRTASKAIARLKEILQQDLAGQDNPCVMMLHANAGAAVAQLTSDIKQLLNLNYTPLAVEAGPAVGTHAGPGALGIAYII